MNTQSEALADGLELGVATRAEQIQAAAELRRLHEVNAELVEALSWLVAAVDADGYSTKYQRGLSKASYALAKAQGETALQRLNKAAEDNGEEL